MCFVRDRLPALFGLLYSREGPDPCNFVHVVGTHHSKSVKLPVYSIKIPTIEVRMRNNFYNWVVSVLVQGVVKDNFGHLLSRGTRESPVLSIYAEGFTQDWIFVPFRSRRLGPNAKFSLTLSSSDYQLFTFLYLLTEQLNLHTGWDYD